MSNRAGTLGRALLVVFAVAGIAVVAWARLEAHAARQAAQPSKARAAGEPIPVRTVPVASQPVDAVIGATALTAPSLTGTVAVGSGPDLSQSNLSVAAVHTRNGAYVEQGDVLFELHSPGLDALEASRAQARDSTRAELERAEAAGKANVTIRDVELASAREELKFREADVESLASDLKQIEELFQQRVANLHEKLEAQAAYAEAVYELTRTKTRLEEAQAAMIIGPIEDRLAVALARASLTEADRTLATLQQQRGLLEVTAVIDGFVDGVTAVAGQNTTPGAQLATVLRIDPIHVVVDYPQERIAELTIDQPAEVVLDAFPGERFQGRVVRIEAQVDAQRRVLPVIVELPNPDRRIRPGISGYARLSARRSAVVAPTAAIIALHESAMVFVVEDGRAAIRPVDTGPAAGPGYVEIRAGLRPGDELVIYGQQFLRPGERVNTDFAQWARREP